jgi:hypothetical protein
MKITEMIEALQYIKDTRGDIECLLTTRYDHYHVKWIDYSECQGHPPEHACIRLDDRKDG